MVSNLVIDNPQINRISCYIDNKLCYHQHIGKIQDTMSDLPMFSEQVQTQFLVLHTEFPLELFYC